MNIGEGKFVMSYQSGLLSYALNIKAQIEEKYLFPVFMQLLKRNSFIFFCFK